MQITNRLPLSPAPALLSPFLVLYKSRLKAAAGAAAGRHRAGAAGGGRGIPPAWGLLPSTAGARAPPGRLRDGPAAAPLRVPVPQPELGSAQALQPLPGGRTCTPFPCFPPWAAPARPRGFAPRGDETAAHPVPVSCQAAGAGTQPARPRLAARTPRLQRWPCQRRAPPATSPASPGERTGTGISQ